jgi:hypothetical protein
MDNLVKKNDKNRHRYRHFVNLRMVFQVKVLVLVVATMAVVLLSYQALQSFTHSSTMPDKFSTDPNPTDDDLWDFGSTSSYKLATTKSLIRNSPNTDETLNDSEKITDRARLPEIMNEISEDEVAQEHSMKPTQTTQLFTSIQEVTENITPTSSRLMGQELTDSNEQSHNPTQRDAENRLNVLFEESKDVFDLLPLSYLPNYKSFCWYDDRKDFQCLASVYLAGMPKCGTTDL